MGWIRVLPIALALGLATATAGAQPSISAVEEKRTALFNQGHALASAGKWAEAAEKFKAVIDLRSAPKAWIALGLAEENLNKLASAKKAYERAAAEAASQGLSDDEESARKGAASLAPRVAHVRVTFADAPQDLRVTLDGAVVNASAQLDVDAGTHTIGASASAFTQFETTIKIANGEQRDIEPVLSAISRGKGSDLLTKIRLRGGRHPRV